MEIEESSLVYLPADCRKILDSMQSKRVEGKAGAEGRGQVSTRERERGSQRVEAGQRAGATGQSQFPLVVALPAFTYTQFSISAVCLKSVKG